MNGIDKFLNRKIEHIVHPLIDEPNGPRRRNEQSEIFLNVVIMDDLDVDNYLLGAIDVDDMNEQMANYLKSMKDDPRDFIISLFWRYLPIPLTGLPNLIDISVLKRTPDFNLI